MIEVFILSVYVCGGGNGYPNCDWHEPMKFETEADCLRVLYPSDNFKFPTIRMGSDFVVARCITRKEKKK